MKNKIVCLLSLLIVVSICCYTLWIRGMAFTERRDGGAPIDNHTSTSSEALNRPTAPRIAQNPENPSEIEEYVDSEALKYGIPTSTVDYIVSHESGWVVDPPLNDVAICKYHLSSKYGQMTASRGLFQLNDCYNPQVSIVCALNPYCATDWSLSEIKTGHILWWSSYAWHLRHPLAK